MLDPGVLSWFREAYGGALVAVGLAFAGRAVVPGDLWAIDDAWHLMEGTA